MKTKSNPSIKKAVQIAFETLPETFRGNDLHRQVKIITGRKFVHVDSSLRKMRILKEEGKINSKLEGSKSESLYQKLNNVPMFHAGKLLKYNRTSRIFEPVIWFMNESLYKKL